MLAFQVKGPVFVPVAAGADGAQLEDGLGDGESPARTGDAHSILHEVPAGTLDDTGGDGQALGEELRVVDVDGVLAQVLDGRVDRVAIGAVEASIGRRLADGRHDVEGM